MEKFDVERHLFYDGYNLDNEVIGKIDYVNSLLENVNSNVFHNKGKIQLIPYFDGKVKEDGGVSGVILGSGFHFTCHTFSYKNTVFVDYFGDDNNKETVTQILFDHFKTDDFDMGSKDKKGYFGKHIIVRPKTLSLEEAKKSINLILKEIQMTQITNVLVNESSSTSFDLLQPIAESHISFHRNNDNMVVDAFSCKCFDVEKFVKLVSENENYTEVNRGLRWKK